MNARRPWIASIGAGAFSASKAAFIANRAYRAAFLLQIGGTDQSYVNLEDVSDPVLLTP